MRYSLGRRPAPDERDAQYPMRALIPRKVTRAHRYWSSNGWWGNQGQTSQCVAYSWVHWLEDGPITQNVAPAPLVTPAQLYAEAQKVDEWPDNSPDDGTSVRAGAKVLQGWGLVGEYHWAHDLLTVMEALLEIGPVVVGTNWYSEMFDPDEEGYVHIGGGIAGGHAWKLDGINTTKGFVRGKNSWGRDWAMKGHFLLSLEDLERLINEDGEACLATELRKKKP